jgi:hypothetical protein
MDTTPTKPANVKCVLQTAKNVLLRISALNVLLDTTQKTANAKSVHRVVKNVLLKKYALNALKST